MQMLKFVLDRLPRDQEGLQSIEAATGVSWRTIEKIVRGDTLNPRIKTIQTLYDHLSRGKGKAPKAARKKRRKPKA